MKIITTSSVFPAQMDAFDTLPRLANLGFDGIDVAFDYCVTNTVDGFMSEHYLDWAKKFREKADVLGVILSHSHAPFDASARGDIVKRTMECASILGAKYTVVHPIWRKSDDSFYEDFDEFVEVNVKAIQPILEAAEKYGVTVLSENLLWGASIHPKAISDLVDAVNSPCFGWCYDTGHAKAFGLSSTDLIGLNSVPLSLHIHDNFGIKWDEHLIPGDGNIDWKEFLDVLKTIGYQGEFVLEAHHQTIDAPDEERDGLLMTLLDRSRKMVAYLNNH